MRKNVILAAVLVVLLALPVAVYGQEAEAEVVAKDFVEAVNRGDAAAVTGAVAEDAVVEAPRAMSGTEAEGGDPAVQEQHVGKAEAEAWFEGHMSANGQTTLGECVVEGEIVTCDAKFASDALAAMGVAELEGELAIQVNAEGMVTSYAFTPAAESAAALSAAGAAAGEAEAAAAAPELIAETGGESLLLFALVVLLGGLLVAGGLGLQRVGRRVH